MVEGAQLGYTNTTKNTPFLCALNEDIAYKTQMSNSNLSFSAERSP